MGVTRYKSTGTEVVVVIVLLLLGTLIVGALFASQSRKAQPANHQHQSLDRGHRDKRP